MRSTILELMLRINLTEKKINVGKLIAFGLYLLMSRCSIGHEVGELLLSLILHDPINLHQWHHAILLFEHLYLLNYSRSSLHLIMYLLLPPRYGLLLSLFKGQ